VPSGAAVISRGAGEAPPTFFLRDVFREFFFNQKDDEMASDSNSFSSANSTTLTVNGGTTSGNSTSSRQLPNLDVSQSLDSHPDFAKPTATLIEAGVSSSGTAPKLGTTPDVAPITGARAYALFSQAMAADFSRESHFTQAATPLSASSEQLLPSLTKPLP
jgi:hypothetical protein